MNWFARLAFAFSVLGAAYQLFALAASIRFFRRARRRWRDGPDHTPPVTILKPLKGLGIELYENLESFCRQDYPDYQIVCGVADEDDPAIAVVERLRRDFPERDIVLSIGATAAANPKVGNLLQMQAHAAHEVLVLSDGDIRVRPDYLRTLVRPLANPRVGLSTCLYRGHGVVGFPSLVESLLINTDFVPMALISNWIGVRAAYGASAAFTQRALQAAGGFAAFADHLADDYLLGNRVAAAGYELAVLPYVVDTVLDAVRFGDVWRHQIRWARTYRAVEPHGWAFAFVIQATAWNVAFCVATGGAPVSLRVLSATLGCRFLALGSLLFQLRERETPRHLWLVPLTDLLVSTVWLVSWLGRTVEWSGRRYRIEPDGRLTPLPRIAARPQRRAPVEPRPGQPDASAW